MINFKEEVEKRKEQLIQDIETLCAIPSVYNEKTIGENQPYGSECRQALDAMLAIGKRDGFVVHDENGYAGHIDIGDQEESFGILGHLDVVPVDARGWDSDPFKVVLRIHIHLWDLLLMLNSLLFMVKKELFVSI